MTSTLRKTPGAWRAVLFLVIAATLIPELLIGSTPLSRINQLLFQFPYYGSAALVIREAVVRLRINRAGLILLGIAFGIVTEGLSLQSIFNPHFLNLDISYGRAVEVNWPWALYMVGYHAVWSITIPVSLTELVFRERRLESWLGGVGLGIFLGLFVLMVVAFHAIFVKMSNYFAPAVPYGIAGILAGGLVGFGLRSRANEVATTRALPPPWMPGAFMFLTGIFWLMLYGEIFRPHHWMTPACNISLGLALSLGFALLLPRFAPAVAPDSHRYSLLAGGLAANTAFGFVVVSGSTIDTSGQIGLVVLLVPALFVFGKRIVRRPQ